jgi:PPOX class probable F420-dependent enzyme
MVDVLLDTTRADDSHTASRLSAEPVIWLGTTRPDGRPHHVPVWFCWRDPEVVLFSMTAAQKLRNLRHQSAVTLTLDSAAAGQDVVIVEGGGRLVTDEVVEGIASTFADKYAPMLGEGGLDRWRTTFTQPVLVTASRVIAWTRREGQLLYRSTP